jgi:Escherichia/Staphylococcus phage prohead protease
MELERRYVDGHSLKVETRSDGEGRLIAGYAAVFDSLSVELWGFRERIAPGAFADSLGDDVRALWNHNTEIVLGRTKANTLRLAEDNTGLRIEISPPASAASYLETIERGDVDQMSIGFRALEDTWDEDADGVLIRTLNKIKLYEVSPVTFPAYPATSVGVRTEERLDPLFGLIPVIPAEFRRASDSADSNTVAAARARWIQRDRLLRVLV